MKRKIYLISFVLLFSSVFYSCSLEETPTDVLPEDEAFRNPTLVYLSTVAHLYNEIGGDGGGRGLGGTDRGVYDLNTFTSDEGIIPTRGGDWYDGGIWQRLYTHKWNVKEDLIRNTWEYFYMVISKTNQSIDQLDRLMGLDPDNAVLPIYKAEVRAVRAMFYYYLVDTYARVPLVTSSLTAIAEVKQSKRSEVYAFVIKELEESMPYLSTANSSNEGSHYGRMTRPVAFFLMAKLALNAQVYNDDAWWLSKDPNGTAPTFTIGGQQVNNWKAVQAYCDSITALGYTLSTDFSANFIIKNETSTENIFVIPMDPLIYKARMMYLVRTLNYNHAAAFNLSGWNGSSATPELIAAFTAGGLEDPRWNKSFFTGAVTLPNGTPVMNGDVPLVYVPEAIALDVSGKVEEKTAGARWKKYEIDPNALESGQLVNNDYVLFRYADVLLMKAEAKVRNGEDGSAELAQVRSRVGAPARAATLDNILSERMLELSWEGFRRQDLIRFGKYNDLVKDRTVSDPYRKVFPIPEDVLNLNSNLTQNEGYKQ